MPKPSVIVRARAIHALLMEHEDPVPTSAITEAMGTNRNRTCDALRWLLSEDLVVRHPDPWPISWTAVHAGPGELTPLRDSIRPAAWMLATDWHTSRDVAVACDTSMDTACSALRAAVQAGFVESVPSGTGWRSLYRIREAWR